MRVCDNKCMIMSLVAVKHSLNVALMFCSVTFLSILGVRISNKN